MVDLGLGRHSLELPHHRVPVLISESDFCFKAKYQATKNNHVEEPRLIRSCEFDLQDHKIRTMKQLDGIKDLFAPDV